MTYAVVPTSSGLNIVVTNTVYNSSGTPFVVEDDAYDSDGNGFTVFFAQIATLSASVLRFIVTANRKFFATGVLSEQ